MKMKEIYSNYKKLVNIKFGEGNFMPLIDMSTQMYLALMYIEEATEIKMAFRKDAVVGFLELTDFIGVHYLFQRYIRADMKKPLRITTDVEVIRCEMITYITRWLRDRQDNKYTAWNLTNKSNEFIGACLNQF